MAVRAAQLVVVVVVLLALFADFLASDRPILLRYQDQTYWFPNLIEYDDLRMLSGDELRMAMDRSDWALWAPIRHGATSVRSGGQLAATQPPSARHWLGTDDSGRDVLARLIHGSRAAVGVALGTALLALALALGLAVAAARWRGQLETALVASCDVVSAVPALVVVIAAQGLWGGGSLLGVIVLIALPRAAETARLAVAGFRHVLAQPFCDAARAVGGSELRVILRHALPHVVPQLAVASAITAATAVLAEAALSFLGFGVAPPQASWGELLMQAHHTGLRWWLLLPSGLAVAVFAGALGALAQPRRR